MKGPYDDIITLERHKSKVHPPMANIMRAAQFSPFDALTGYSDAIRESGRITEEKLILTEDKKAELDELLRQLCNKPGNVEITYFIGDALKAGGHYQTILTKVIRIDSNRRELITIDSKLMIDNIVDIKIPKTD